MCVYVCVRVHTRAHIPTPTFLCFLVLLYLYTQGKIFYIKTGIIYSGKEYKEDLI